MVGYGLVFVYIERYGWRGGGARPPVVILIWPQQQLRRTRSCGQTKTIYAKDSPYSCTAVSAGRASYSCTTPRIVVSSRQRVAVVALVPCLSSSAAAPPSVVSTPQPSQVAHFPPARMVLSLPACTAMDATAMDTCSQAARTSLEGPAGRSRGWRRSIQMQCSPPEAR